MAYASAETAADKNGLVNELFYAQEQRPAALQPIDWLALTPLQRALLITDGMVTHLLEGTCLPGHH